jgi:hypothetical protein
MPTQTRSLSNTTPSTSAFTCDIVFCAIITTGSELEGRGKMEEVFLEPKTKDRAQPEPVQEEACARGLLRQKRKERNILPLFLHCNLSLHPVGWT